MLEHAHARQGAGDRIVLARAELTTNPLHSVNLRKYCSRLAASRRSGLHSRKHGDTAPWLQRCPCTTTPVLRAAQASVCSSPMKQVCVLQGSMECQPRLATTKSVRESPTTSRVCRDRKSARKRASQLFRLQTGKDIVVQCSTIHCARDDGGSGFHCVLLQSSDDES